MKKILYIIVSLLILSVVVYLYIYAVKPEENSADDWANFPDAAQQPSSKADTLQLESDNGLVTTRNFFKDPLTTEDPINPGHYQLGNFIDPRVEGEPNNLFYIEYLSETQYFIVSLLQEPIAESRNKAEQFLLKHLDVSEEELCSLKYMVSVPARVDLTYTGTNLGFSFCPEAVSL